MTKKPETIPQYKKALRKLSVEIDQIRKFGDLRKKQTWETAYARYSNHPSHIGPNIGNSASSNCNLTDQERNLLFGDLTHEADETGQLLLFAIKDDIEPPDPDDYPNDYEYHYQLWAERYPNHAKALVKWEEKDSSETIVIGSGVPIYHKGFWKPTVDEWELGEFTNQKVNKKVAKFYQQVDETYPIEFLMVCFHSIWKVKQTLALSTPVKITLFNHNKRLFKEIDSRYVRFAWVSQTLPFFIHVKNSNGDLFCRQYFNNRTNINHNYRYPFKVFAKASDVNICRERSPP